MLNHQAKTLGCYIILFAFGSWLEYLDIRKWEGASLACGRKNKMKDKNWDALQPNMEILKSGLGTMSVLN